MEINQNLAETERHTGINLRTLLENTNLTVPIMHQVKEQQDKKEVDWQENFDVSVAFLGPTLWNKTLSYDGDMKMQYTDLEEFFSENDLQFPNSPSKNHSSGSISDDSSESTRSKIKNRDTSTPPSRKHESQEHQTEKKELTINYGHNRSCSNNIVKVKEECVSDLNDIMASKFHVNFSPADVALATIPGQNGFDPGCHSFAEEELKPQPMIKKSKKQFVPDNMKDERYWARRKKNNVAAKRSRDARRIKENQIALRAAYLEKESDILRKENNAIKMELENLQKENELILAKLRKYERC